MANSCFFAHSRYLSCGDVLRKNAALFQGHTLVHGGSDNWDPNGRPQTAELQAFLGFPAQLAACPTAAISGAAPVNVTLTLDENESKVKYYFWCHGPHLEGPSKGFWNRCALSSQTGLYSANFALKRGSQWPPQSREALPL
jgi:hypothetical protein